MPCNAPPPLSEDALSAALDGVAPPDVLAHLQTCPGCAARMEEARRVERALSASLDRRDCPPPAQLADFHWDLLAPEQRALIAAHLTHCGRCTEELEDLRAFLAAESVPNLTRPPRPIGGRRAAVNAHLAPSSSQLQFAGVRGRGTDCLIAQSSIATVALEPFCEKHGLIGLTGHIADGVGDQSHWDGALVEVRQGHTIVGTAFADDLGSFRCSPLAGGSIELRITPADGPPLVIAGLVL